MGEKHANSQSIGGPGRSSIVRFPGGLGSGVATMFDESPSNRRKARAIRQRDNNECRLCGKSERDGVRIEFHRVIPRSADEGDSLSNYLLLCASHHEQAHQSPLLET